MEEFQGAGNGEEEGLLEVCGEGRGEGDGACGGGGRGKDGGDELVEGAGVTSSKGSGQRRLKNAFRLRIEQKWMYIMSGGGRRERERLIATLRARLIYDTMLVSWYTSAR